MRLATTCLIACVVLSACSKKAAPERPSVSALEPAPQDAALSSEKPAEAAPPPAALGSPAPDFKLTDLDGNTVSLSSFRGKTIVLEWFNPECPFVRASHTKGSLKDAALRHQANGVVWLAINSGSPGKQGHGRETNIKGRDAFGMKHPILLDESGSVGRLYGAKRTPHLYIIDPIGNLVYRGAIDNSPDGEGESPSSGALIRHVDVALGELAQNKTVSVSETEAYGCSVKYGS
jgi:peroxiredoxin